MRGLSTLVIDDDKALRKTIRTCLESLGCRVEEAPSAPAMRAALERKRFDLALLDTRLGNVDGIEILPLLTGGNQSMDVIVMSGSASISSAIEAMRRGATDYLAKPFSPTQLRELVERVAARRVLDQRLETERKRRNHAFPEIHLQTESPPMLQALDLIARAAVGDHAILLIGEAGTGKGLLARRLHALSTRGSAPFVATEIQDDRDIVFLGASASATNGGTLFIDGIDRLTPAQQDELLDHAPADLRIVAATTKEMALDRFVTLHVPPLRERRGDIAPLARRALAFYAQGTPVPVAELTLEAEKALVSYAWPGNVRELCQTMERAVVLRAGVRVGPEALPTAITSCRSTSPYLGGEFSLETIEREHIFRVLARAGSIDEASRILGIDPSTLWRKRKRYEE